MSTIKDVARRTGLSLSTISKYLNGGNVREENRLAIGAAAMNASSAAMTSIGIRNSVSWISLRAIM